MTLRRILLAEDNAQLRAALRMALQEARYEVVACPNGTDALRQLDVQQFDLLVVDLFMPEMNGLELIEELRLRSSRIPIIAMTGRRSLGFSNDSHLGVDFLKEAQTFGADLTLPKPFSTEQFLEAVTQCISRS